MQEANKYIYIYINKKYVPNLYIYVYIHILTSSQPGYVGRMLTEACHPLRVLESEARQQLCADACGAWPHEQNPPLLRLLMPMVNFWELSVEPNSHLSPGSGAASVYSSDPLPSWH